MSGDAFSEILAEMRGQARSVAPPGMCLGTVMEYSARRLVIQAKGMMLENDDLMVNAELLYDAVMEAEASYDGQLGQVTLEVDQSVAATASCGRGAIDSITLTDVPGQLSGTGTVRVTVKTRRLAVGDQVLMQPTADGQIYYVICKVVRM